MHNLRLTSGTLQALGLCGALAALAGCGASKQTISSHNVSPAAHRSGLTGSIIFRRFFDASHHSGALFIIGADGRRERQLSHLPPAWSTPSTARPAMRPVTQRSSSAGPTPTAADRCGASTPTAATSIACAHWPACQATGGPPSRLMAASSPSPARGESRTATRTSRPVSTLCAQTAPQPGLSQRSATRPT